jgi:hypothetical protein
MRKFLVKNFVLDYRVKLFGKCYNAPRASRIIFPLFVITGMANALNENFPTPTIFIWVLYALSALSLFFGFFYFNLKPVKFEELDNYQKLQFGFVNFTKMRTKERKEWKKIKEIYFNTGGNC